MLSERCKVCNHMLEFGSCGNSHTYCDWCGYSDGIDGEHIPEWDEDTEWQRLKLEYDWLKLNE